MANHPADSRREAICAWLTANHIQPNDVPIDGDITIRGTPDGRVIRYEAFVRGDNGYVIVDERSEGVAVEVRTVPLKTEPPKWWQPYQKPTREQLLKQRDRLVAALREALDCITLGAGQHQNPADLDRWRETLDTITGQEQP